jgi:AbrB family looped-hinge helix DNA binding protein
MVNSVSFFLVDRFVKGHVTIPKEIREYLDVRPGDHIYFESSKEGIIIKKAYSKK